MQLEGRVALVTGGGSGMGLSHCRELARRGAAVGVNDIADDACRMVSQAITLGGGKAVALPADVTDRRQVESIVESLAATFGGIDILVSNAGTIHADTGLLDTDEDDFWRTIKVNLGGCLNTSRACMPWLVKSPAPRIVVIGSTWGERGEGFGYGYVSAKGALMAFARNLAKEFGPERVLVNVVSPGSVPTRMAAGWTPEMIAEDCKGIPLGRWAETQEISNLVAYLASSESSYLTGQTISVNGGQVIRGM